jgi:phage FluMu protein Com
MSQLYQAGITPPPAHGGRGNRNFLLMESSPPAAVRCASCRALLFKAGRDAISGVIEIKCRRCGTINSMRPPSPSETASRAALGSLPCGPTCPIRARTG